ncbi:MAG: putative maltokinase, partial [Acidobacteria bacterium]|nr:putative maltokinase [Acidobacteriota bacterium]
NYDNPEVQEEMISVLRFWLDQGLDGFRLDAVPYHNEREGTESANLPETHEFLKRIRRELDAQYEGRVLLAEANQWPSDVRAYFGDGDECHMAFHFPLMPRMFMGLRQEDRHPIVEIVNQTPDIPETCQWALFLRNHDELTLEMVADEERDYMYAQYAADPQMRVNVGIRRRLAPLMENSRRRIELMNCLLFSMPGTPIIYYGDEIAMGDNVYLGDRNGVRTPMQWSSDRNAGFSRADPARLYAPVIMDPVYGYEAINVEAQERSPFSLLHWMKRMIALRKQHKVFGRGSIEFIRTANRKVLAYVRRYEQDIVLCVANLARTPQPAEIPLAPFVGLTPVEMMGSTEFPRIGEQPYVLTLAPYGFYWFQLQDVVTPITARPVPLADEHAAAPALFAGVVWDSILDGGMRAIIERQALAPFLERQRWFGGKARPLAGARFLDWTPVRRGAHPAFLTIVEAEYRDGGREQYVLPLAMSSDKDAAAVESAHSGAVLARITGARKGLLYDGLLDDGTCATLLGIIEERRELSMRRGGLRGVNLAVTAERAPADALTPIARSSPDQSNSSLTFGQRLVMKLFRRLQPGPNPDVEIGEFLAARGFTRVPRLMGSISYAAAGEEASAVAMLQEFAWNQGSGWQVTIEELARYFERVMGLPLPRLAEDEAAAWLRAEDATAPASVVDAIGTYLATADILGRRTGELHVQLAAASPSAMAFEPEPFTADDLRALSEAMRARAERGLALLESSVDRLDDRGRELARGVLGHRGELLRRFERADGIRQAGSRIRCHGDYHLGQVLVNEGDIAILDFEGEPARPLAERRAKSSPLRDVAGMLRSFSYVALTSLSAATLARPEDVERLTPWADLWETWVGAVYLRAYLAASRDAAILPSRADDIDALLQLFLVEKAIYELGYELNNRPDWVHVPLAGLLHLIDTSAKLRRSAIATQMSRNTRDGA